MRSDTLLFHIFWHEPGLALDLGILYRGGRIAASDPAAWFREAAGSYDPSNAGGAFARLTLQLVGAAFAAGRAS